MMKMHIFTSPYREYLVAVVLVIGLVDHYLLTPVWWILWPIALFGAITPFAEAWKGMKERRITIEAFNFLALAASLATGEIASAIFIGLMLTFAAYLDWRTESRASNAVEELLKLKPHKANRESGGTIEEIESDQVRVGDILIVKNGDRIPVDGVIIYGEALLNESSITGESRPVEKDVGDSVYSATISETGVIKIRATKVGKDSTIERMAQLIREAAAQKSRSERLADRFAGIFLPVVLLIGIATYWWSGSLSMTIAFFLVVCADDIAVSIPLAVTASLGLAAKRGVIIKGGEWLDALAKVKIIIFDKTGTLTYGDFRLTETRLAPGVDEPQFWKMVGVAEKFSEHPVGRAIFKEAKKRSDAIPDPDEIKVEKGVGVEARLGAHTIAIGNEKLITQDGLSLSDDVRKEYEELLSRGNTLMFVFINRVYQGILAITDVPRKEAKESIEKLKSNGIRVIMLTGDNDVVAQEICQKLGIAECHSGMTPEGKLDEISRLSQEGVLAMVGDGINDAPALARANIGIAMGSGGAVVTVEAGNIVILTDEIARIPEMIRLAQRTVSVVNADMGIWFVTNAFGILLVLTGVAGPAFAAFYNFATDFIPLLNSARLFRGRS